MLKSIMKSILKWTAITFFITIYISYMLIKFKIYFFIVMVLLILGLYVTHSFMLSFGVTKTHKIHNHSQIKNNSISNEFKIIYDYIKKEYGDALESDRKKLKNSLILLFMFFLICTTIIMHLFLILGYAVIFFLPVFIPAIKLIKKYKLYKEIYVVNFKENIIRNFINYFNPDFNYDQQGRDFLLNYYLNAEFKDKYYNLFSSDDYIEGSVGDNINIAMCNFSLENVTDKNEFLNMVYEGIFSTTTLHTSVPTAIRIKINNSWYKNKNKKINMDNPEFEKYFDVYCDSNILGMQVLTHDVMEQLIQFYITYKIEFEIVIKHNHIYIRFNTGMMFEPNIFKTSHDMITLWIYYSIINFSTNLTTQINKSLKTLEV